MDNEQKATISFKIHPRIFASLGADLVTDDVVAVLELVKNSYDAFAKNVWVKFGKDIDGAYLEILDDGDGMNHDTIENVWCVVATPNKIENPEIKHGNKKRRVSGEKGLGRLSSARLGTDFTMITKTEIDKPWQVIVDWNAITKSTELDSCVINCIEYKGVLPFEKKGTQIKITKLNSIWTEAMIFDLKENLARMISPFSEAEDFKIFLKKDDNGEEEQTEITIPKFFSKPKYELTCTYNSENELICKYFYDDIIGNNKRNTSKKISWIKIFSAVDNEEEKSRKPSCGKFSFEIRAWDLDSEGIEEIQENFGMKKRAIRDHIKAHKGISIYRDKVLVLPKSDKSIDWLGLDLRRVSKVGSRLSTSQLVGYVAITAEDNGKIIDTSDRERLVVNKEVRELEMIIMEGIKFLEDERYKDKDVIEKEKPMENIFKEISAEKLVSDISSMAQDGATASEALPIIQEFNRTLDKTKIIIQERFIYYSRMATIGTIAQMLVHEIRNRTTIIGALLKLMDKEFSKNFSEKDRTYFQYAIESVASLDTLAETFAPLASRSFKRTKRNSNLMERIKGCLILQKGDIEKLKIETKISKLLNIDVLVDPGELDAVIYNLLINSIYWISDSTIKIRRIEFNVVKEADDKRIHLSVDDTGPGMAEDIVHKAMWPGETKKPGGIGMGLTVSAEIISSYGGKMTVKHPGTIGGASIIFDLPIKG